MTEAKELTMKELTAVVDALNSALKAQHLLNQSVYNILGELENRISDLEYPKATLIDEVIY